MGELRAAGAPDEHPEDRARLRALADAFPGALRELDTLPTDEIERRRNALLAAAAAADDTPLEPWIAWMHGYHSLMRAALKLKRRPFTDEELAELAVETGVPLDAAFVRAVAAPPHGRIMVVVFERLSAWFSLPSKTLWDELFPPRKGPRGYR